MSGRNEQLLGATLRAPLSAETSSAFNQFCGRTTLNSGDATVTVSTATVKADSVIQFAVQAHVDQASGSITRGIEVKTINPGNHFILGTADGIADIRDVTIMWNIIQSS